MHLGLYGQSEDIDLAIYDENAQFLDDGITFAVGDVKISKDSGTYNPTANLPVLIANGKTWKLTLTASEKTCARYAVQIKDQDGPSFTDNVFYGYTYGHASAHIPSMPATIAAGAISSGAIASGSIASGELNNIADAILKRDLAAVVGEASRSLKKAIQFIRNKWSISGSTLTVTAEDDTTPSWTANVSTTSGAHPVTGVDPA